MMHTSSSLPTVLAGSVLALSLPLFACSSTPEPLPNLPPPEYEAPRPFPGGDAADSAAAQPDPFAGAEPTAQPAPMAPEPPPEPEPEPEPAGAEPPPEPEAKKKPVAEGGAIGIASCDGYLSKLEACIAKSQNPGPLEHVLAQNQDKWKRAAADAKDDAARAQLEKTCKQALEALAGIPTCKE